MRSVEGVNADRSDTHPSMQHAPQILLTDTIVLMVLFLLLYLLAYGRDGYHHHAAGARL